MTVRFADMQRVLAYAAAHLDQDISLGRLASKAGVSPFHLHRAFSTALRETPKHLTHRLRLGRAAALLLTTDESVLNVALSCGFQSHEVFCRAFRRRFGIAPKAYRKRGFAQQVDSSQASQHAAVVDGLAPCLGLYHIGEKPCFQEEQMSYSVTKKELAPQPVLVVRRRVKRSDIAGTIAEALPHVFIYAEQHGIALAGLPFTRYIDVGPGLVTMEPGMRVAASGQPSIAVDPAWTQTSGETSVFSGTLPGGSVASTIHMGPYDRLSDAYAAIEQWMEAQGLMPSGPPWESYLTDPAEYPDPKDWKTEVCWPVKS